MRKQFFRGSQVLQRHIPLQTSMKKALRRLAWMMQPELDFNDMEAAPMTIRFPRQR